MKSSITRRTLSAIFGLTCFLLAAQNSTAAPFEIEGPIKEVKKIATKNPAAALSVGVRLSSLSKQ